MDIFLRLKDYQKILISLKNDQNITQNAEISNYSNKSVIKKVISPKIKQSIKLNTEISNNYKCLCCQKSFPTRNKLFNHIKLKNH